MIGNVIHSEARDMYISRCISIGAGMAESAPALTVNRLCGSGLHAITSATQLLLLGDADIALAGGVEVMSKGGHLMPSLRWGSRMGDATAHDMMLGALQDPFGLGHMGITAENIAADEGISREDQDAFAAESQRRAAAEAFGYFKIKSPRLTSPNAVKPPVLTRMNIRKKPPSIVWLACACLSKMAA